jgi:hypothetical protein
MRGRRRTRVMQTPRSLLLPPLFGAAALLALTILGPAAQAQAGGQAKPAGRRPPRRSPRRRRRRPDPGRGEPGRRPQRKSRGDAVHGPLAIPGPGGHVTDTYTLKVPTSEQDYGKYSSDGGLRCEHPHLHAQGRLHLCRGESPGQERPENRPSNSGATSGTPRRPWPTRRGAPTRPSPTTCCPGRLGHQAAPARRGSGDDRPVRRAQGTELKDLVFTLNNWSDMKGKEVRVSLNK